MITLELVAGWSALIAAVATVVGAVTLMVFFARGGLWGLGNDIASIVLMLATIPVAFGIGTFDSERNSTMALVATAIGVIGMVGAAVSQGLLVARVRTYEQLLPWTLGAGVVVGAWYLMAGLLALGGALPALLPILMIVAGLGFVAIGYGFAVGGQKHPLAAIGGLALFVASTAFLAWLGWLLVRGELTIPVWNL